MYKHLLKCLFKGITSTQQKHLCSKLFKLMSKLHLLKSKFDNPSYLIYKSNRCYDSQLKVVQKGLKKRGFNFTYDGTPDEEKESSVNQSKEKCAS